ncbi:LIM domain only protein 3-like isoform X3 [Artemia franciscana]
MTDKPQLGPFTNYLAASEGVRMVRSSAPNSERESGIISIPASDKPHKCCGCGKIIADRFLLQALDGYWHEDCLKCGCCDCRLGEVGSTLFTRANLILCRRDYLRLFGTTGSCSACGKVIPAFEMVMRARTNVYHLECFACQQCNHRFCVGDRFYLCDNKILCEYDYEERMVFASMAYSPGSLAQARKQQPSNEEGSFSSAKIPGRHIDANPRLQPPMHPGTSNILLNLKLLQGGPKPSGSPEGGSSSGYGSPSSPIFET